MRRRIGILGCIAVLLVPGAAAQAAGQMTVAAFIAKAEALQAKGMMAMLSPDIGLLKDEVQGSAKAFRQRLKAEAATGGKPSACPPERASLTSNDILGHMRGYPAATQARTTVAEAVADLFRKRFPCPAR